MLKWIFVLFIAGEPVLTLPEPTEERCEHAKTAVLQLKKAQGKKAEGSCYVRIDK